MVCGAENRKIQPPTTLPPDHVSLTERVSCFLEWGTKRASEEPRTPSRPRGGGESKLCGGGNRHAPVSAILRATAHTDEERSAGARRHAHAVDNAVAACDGADAVIHRRPLRWLRRRPPLDHLQKLLHRQVSPFPSLPPHAPTATSPPPRPSRTAVHHLAAATSFTSHHTAALSPPPASRFSLPHGQPRQGPRLRRLAAQTWWTGSARRVRSCGRHWSLISS